MPVSLQIQSIIKRKMHGLENINTKELGIFTCIENTRNGWNRIEKHV